MLCLRSLTRLYRRLGAVVAARRRAGGASWRARVSHAGGRWRACEPRSLQALSTRRLLWSGLGLLGGGLLGVHVALSPGCIALLVLTAGLLLVPWPLPFLQRCCRWLFLGLVAAHGHTAWQARALPLTHISHHLAQPTRTPVSLEGTVARPLEASGERLHLYLALQRWQRHHTWQPVTGMVRLTVHTMTLPFLPGDLVRVRQLRLHPGSGYGNPGSVDAQRLLRWQGIYALGGLSQPDRVQLLHRPRGFRLARRLARWRQHLYASVRAHCTPPYDTLFLAMVLGQHGPLPTAILESFRQSGTTHLLVASGLNVGFITASVFWLWRAGLRLLRSRWPRTWRLSWRPTPVAAWLSFPPMLLYCTIVGWEVPITRAALMASSYLVALIVARQRDPLYALLLAAALLMLGTPTAILTTGFQLSFMAVLSLLLTVRRGRHPANPAPTPMSWGQRVRTYLATNLAVYGGTIPILLTAFRTVPTFGIPANMLLVPLAGLLTPTGMLALSAVLLWPGLGPLIFPPFAVLLAWMAWVTEVIAGLPGAQWHFAAPSWPILLGYYGVLGCLLWWPWPRHRWSCGGVALGLLLLGLYGQYTGTRSPHLRVTFLDVGAGDAIFIQMPGNRFMVLDGGGTHDGRFDVGRHVVAPVLWDQYVHHLDLMALTHPQANHARGLVSLLRLFPTGHFLSNGTPLATGYLHDLTTAGQRWGTQYHTARNGPRTWQWDAVHLTILAPPGAGTATQTAWAPRTENDRSLVLRLQHGAVRMLFTGDIQHATERWLLAHYPDLRAEILQVPHHGSQTSTLPAFVAQVRPAVGVISAGTGNPYGHPHTRVLEVLHAQQVQVWRTDLHGAVTITSDGQRYRVTSFRPFRPFETTTPVRQAQTPGTPPTMPRHDASFSKPIAPVADH